MLKNRLGYMAYLLLRNDVGWKMLSESERQRVLNDNKSHNVDREDYSNPQKYGANRYEGGENWDNFKLTHDDIRANVLLNILNESRSSKVLEIGPGAGFHTRLICEHDTVSEYRAVDIGRAFLDFLKPKLESVKQRKNFNYDLITGEITAINLPDKYNLIVLLSTVHHIPNRVELFRKLNDMLADGGAIYCFDPSHYLPRIIGLFKKCVFDGYLRKEEYLENVSTHHMCSLGEYKRIVRQVSGLKIENKFYIIPQRLKKIEKLLWPQSLFSNQIGVVLRKKVVE